MTCGTHSCVDVSHCGRTTRKLNAGLDLSTRQDCATPHVNSRTNADYGNADFVIGYYDRVFKRIVRVSFERIRLERGQHFWFDLIGRDGEARMVPFYRVREVMRNGVVVEAAGAGVDNAGS